MAQALSKEEHLTVSNLMEREHWDILIEEQIIPTIPLWRTLMTNLRFWERLVTQTLCRFAQKATALWSHLSTGFSVSSVASSSGATLREVIQGSRRQWVPEPTITMQRPLHHHA